MAYPSARTSQNAHHVAAVKRRNAKLHANAMKRYNAAHAAPPVNPDQPLVDAAVRLKYGPQQDALNQQIQQNTRYTSGLSDWYSNAMNEIRGLQAQQAAQSQQQLGALTNYASQATLANPTDQQAAASRNALQAQFANESSRDAASNSAAMDRLAAAYAAQQGNSAYQANVQRQQLLAQQGQLGSQKADYATTYGADLAQAEQKALSDAQKNQIAAKALGLKVDTLNKVQIPLAQSLMTNRTASQKTARSNVRLKKSQQAETKHQNAVNNALKVGSQSEKALNDSLKLQQKGKGSNKSNGRYTQTQLNKYDNQWRGALALADHLKAAGSYVDKKTKKTLPITRDVVYSALLKEYPNDPEFASAAADLAYGRGLSARDRHILSTKGVHPKTLGPTLKKGLKGIENAPTIIRQLNALNLGGST